MSQITCHCGFKVFDSPILRIRVGQFSKGFMNLKCPKCKRYMDGLSIKYLIDDGLKIDYRKGGNNG